MDRSLFLSDGNRLRLVTPQGTIRTLVGGPAPAHHLAAVGCGAASFLAAQVELHWPAQLAISPLDGSLHLVDNNQVDRWPCPGRQGGGQPMGGGGGWASIG